MSDIMVKAEHISKSFGANEVLKDISFTLEKGNVLSIIGPSGSGKSTLLRIITQLEKADVINELRLTRWQQYNELLQPLKERGLIELPYIPKHCVHNAHMYYIKTKDLEERTRLFSFLKDESGILPASHYVPLHSAPAGLKFCRFHGEDKYTTKESERLLRLPMFYTLKESEVDYIVSKVKEFYHV